MPKIFNDEMLTFMKNNAIGLFSVELTELVNREFGTSLSVKQIKIAKKNYKISSGLDGRFKKGSVPHNKDVKGLHYSPKTEFKKGNRPANHRQVGSTRITKDGYQEIKTSEPRTWRHLHRVMWEKVNGEIPKGHTVVFADGNKNNLSAENFILVSRAQLVRMNQSGLIFNDAELTKAGANIASLLNATGKAERNKNERRRHCSQPIGAGTAKAKTDV